MKSGLYNLPLSGLKEGSHLYDYKIEGEFFEKFEGSEIHDCSLDVHINLLKRSNHLEVNVSIEGEAGIMCDRCLEVYSQPVSATNRILVKYGDQWEEVDDEIIMIPRGETELDLSQLLYEFAHLALPLRRVHPDDKDGNPACDPLMLEKLAEHNKKTEESTDPRWKGLEDLKNNIN